MRNICSVALFVLFMSPIARANTYSGDVVVKTIDSTRVAVFLDENGDHSIDNGFLLTTDIPMHNTISVRLDAAKLLFTDGYVRVTSKGTVYDLQVAGYPDPPAAPKGSEVVTLIGSALMHSKGESGCSIQRAFEKDASACYHYDKK